MSFKDVLKSIIGSGKRVDIIINGLPDVVYSDKLESHDWVFSRTGEMTGIHTCKNCNATLQVTSNYISLNIVIRITSNGSVEIPTNWYGCYTENEIICKDIIV